MTYRNILIFFLAIGASTLFANQSFHKKKKVTITAEIADCGNELGIYRFDGVGFLLLESVKAKVNEPFIFELEQEATTVLYLGKDKQQKRPLVIGPEEAIHIKGDCNRIRNSKIIESDWNKQYDQVISAVQKNKRDKKRLAQGYQRGQKSQEAMQSFQEAMKNLDLENHVFIDSIMQINPFLGKLAAINSYQSFIGNKGIYKNELDHYGYEFFADIQLEDSAYDHLTYLFEAYREYAGTLAKTNIPKERLNKYIDHSLKRIDANRPAYKIALGGIVLGLQGTQHPSYLHYGDIFIEKYNNGKAVYIQDLANQLDGARALQNGGVAPDFSAATPDGKELSLSELRGNYVLIDFWASWCGPCRKENPNVVRLYNKYHDMGFDILGVSLDNKKERWLAAIEKDGLTWHHISDLKGWKSGPAGIYGIRSIPSTILLDKEGKIIARNLRAHQLEGKLKELFGE